MRPNLMYEHLSTVYQRLPLDAVLTCGELGQLWPIPSTIVGLRPRCPGCSRGKENPKKFCETALQTHQECHHFDHIEVSNDLTAIVVILQGTQQHLDTGVVLSEVQVHKVSHGERQVLVTTMK